MPVQARRLTRKLRGGAQSQLIECDNGKFHVVKFRNNPQHRRILVNEWIASVFLKYLQISSPDTQIVNVNQDFLEANPDCYMQLGSKRLHPEPGWHFGSEHPGDPARLSVYDFIPDVLIEKVANLREFLGILAVDKWMGNADARQSIFFRARIREWVPTYEAHPTKLGFVAHMIDHGYMFNGPHWGFTDSPLHGLYFRPMVYREARGFDDFQPWLDRVSHFPEEIVDQAVKQSLPDGWREMRTLWRPCSNVSCSAANGYQN
jgi:hypothetical protein